MKGKIRATMDGADVANEPCCLYRHGGEEIVHDDAQTLGDVFGHCGSGDGAREVEIAFDCSRFEAAPVKISCEGPDSATVLDNKGAAVEVMPNVAPADVALPRHRAFVSDVTGDTDGLVPYYKGFQTLIFVREIVMTIQLKYNFLTDMIRGRFFKVAGFKR